ncbi:MAG: hypothetical protein QOE36_365 [Gaiellaceae bacterium]|jgi:hypothetical protein|nr:hypothetical protein [Gaiellaceae bacterium]
MVERSRVKVPPGVQGPFEVYLNGVPQQEGRDFRRADGDLIFERPLETEGRLGPMRWLSMWLGIAGTYRKDDKVDIVYRAGERRLVATGLPFEREPV